MANDFIPLIQVLRELRSLTAKKASGFFFVVTEENHSCIIRLHGGQIDEVVFRMLRGDEAVQRLSMVNAARGRFQVDPASKSSGKAALSEDSLQWLLGGFEQALSRTQAAPVAAAVAAPAGMPAGGAPSEAQRKLIENIALQYFGPIAGMLCDEAFETPAPLASQLEQLASNLSSPDETKGFLQEVRAGLDKLPH
ncbi:hypothetical protein [Pseudoxanthomonas sp. JBR18]|uniref:hypothetical protein n=1 Tax=Pseudoxanthomonas sp. JBR18 TaxID=2969308 RepID=UPI0023054792|nr:hypothetical protein [Pseudoxanthomonas sp. JBR18]WCE03433.1 hypothetical protein PJ250_15210 [Pseudoxanthomonas sp. JBR18]